MEVGDFDTSTTRKCHDPLDKQDQGSSLETETAKIQVTTQINSTNNLVELHNWSLTHPSPRHAKSRDHATIGRGNIFRLRKDKDLSTVLFQN